MGAIRAIAFGFNEWFWGLGLFGSGIRYLAVLQASAEQKMADKFGDPKKP